MSRSLDRLVVRDYEGRTASEILDSSPEAIEGVSSADATRLQQAFGIKTVRAMAESRHFAKARAVRAAAGAPAFDPGPPDDWETFFSTAPLLHYQDFPSEFRLDFGPVYYRGRLDGTARVVVVGQDPSVNEILARRIFVGHSGQRVQRFLDKLGIRSSYTMLNVFLYPVYGQVTGNLRTLGREDPILGYRNQFLDRLAESNPLEAIVAVGAAGRDAVERWPGSAALPVANITHPAARDEQVLIASWNAGLDLLRPLVSPDDDATADSLPFGESFTDADAVPIPRRDLPFGVPDWHGVGSHAHRDDDDDTRRIVWEAP